MAKIAIVSDTTADLPDKLAENLDIHLVNAFVHIGTESFVIGDLTLDEFYSRMKSASDDEFPKTSQPKSRDILELYENLKADGYDGILSIHVAANLSGTINSAHVAKGMIDNIEIRIIDSQGVSANLIAVLQKARSLVDQGKDINTIVSELESFAAKIESYITLKSLENLMKGGRISPIRYRFGSLFRIKPILRLKKGELKPYAKSIGLNRARNKMYDIATEAYSKTDSFQYIIAHTRELQDATDLENRLKTDYPKAEGMILEIGIVVAVHAGEGALLLLLYPEI